MSYNPFDFKDLWDITKIQNFYNPLSPFYTGRNRENATKIKDLIPRKPQKKYIRTEEDEKEDIILFVMCVIGILIAYIICNLVIK